jgi:cobalt-zinc-cadmium resistance protein CzcA
VSHTVLGKLIEALVRRRALVILGALGFFGYGLLRFSQLNVEAFPDVTNLMVQVIAIYPGQAAEEVERQVTLPLERELNGIPRMSGIRSISVFGLSQVTLIFEDDTDVYFARQQVAERLARAEMPEGVTPILGPLYTPVGEIYRYTLASDRHPPMVLRTYQDWVIERKIRQLPGVVDVVVFGGQQKQLELHVDPVRLRAYGLTLAQVYESLKAANVNTGGGYLAHGEQELVVRGIGLLEKAEDLKNVVLASKGGTPILVRDVGEIVEGAVLRRGGAGRNENPDAVEGIVLMRKGENPSVVLEAVRAKVRELNERILPEGIRIVPFYDRSWLIERTLRTVGVNLLEGAILVIAVLYIFLRSLRGALLAAAIIPFGMLTAFVFLYHRGMPANLISMGAIDFGMLVDGAVVLVESIHRNLAHRRARSSAEIHQGVVAGTLEVFRPTLFSMAIIIAALLPILTLERVEGRIFAPLAFTYSAALLGGLVFALLLVPAGTSLYRRTGSLERESAWLAALKSSYRRALAQVIRFRWVAVAFSALLLGGSLLLAGRLGAEFLPELNEGDIYVTAALPNSIALQEGERLAGEMRRIARSFPEVMDVLSQIGRPEDGTDTAQVNQVTLHVKLVPEEEWTTGRSKQALIAQMRAALGTMPGAQFNFSQPIVDNVLENISGVIGTVSIKAFGSDFRKLGPVAESVRQAVEKVPGSVDVSLYKSGIMPQLHVRVDRAKTARYGVSVADLQRVVEMALVGKVATYFWEGEWKFPVVVRLREDYRDRAEAIAQIPVETAGGSRVPLSELADIRVDFGRMTIFREDNSPFLAVKANVQGRDLGGWVAEAQARVEAEVKLPEGVYLVWGGEFENQQRAMKRLSIVVPVSIGVIFGLLTLALASIRSALLILLNAPFALIGGIVMLYATKVNLSVSAAVGFIALLGQAVLNGVIMVSYINQLRREGKSLQEAVLTGATVRLPTVLMTALLAGLGLVPAALSTAMGSETQRPIALVVTGGLVSATLLTLFVLPALYGIFEGERAWRRRMKQETEALEPSSGGASP